VEARGIAKSFGKTQVLKGIDLTVREGTVLALLGPNGAGKTTTVRILTTLLEPDSGTVMVAGYNARREPDKVRGRIGVAGQSVTMDGYLSGLQNLMMIVMRGLARGGTTLLLTTQYIEEADQLADTATIIDHGRIITSDTPARLKDELGGERLDITLADPAAIDTIPELAGKALPVQVRKETLSFAVPTGEPGLKEVTSILQRLVSEGVAVDSYTLQRPTLEEAFLQLVGTSSGTAAATEGN
jgi:ABC-type multidrug transport system ATPase subunit